MSSAQLEQLTLEDWTRTHSRSSNPDTSRAAARSVRTAAAIQCEAIVDVLARAATPLNAEEIASQIPDMDRVQVGRRMSDLRRAGVVRRTEQTRATSSGRRATCYALVQTRAS